MNCFVSSQFLISRPQAVPAISISRPGSPKRRCHLVSLASELDSAAGFGFRGSSESASARSSAGARSEAAVRIMHVTSDHEREDAFKLWRTVGFDRDDADDEHDTEYVVARENKRRVLGAGRTVRCGPNVQISRVYVQDEFRGQGLGRKIVEKLMKVAAPIKGALHVEATRDELGFYSILGFETQGNEYFQNAVLCRHMVYRVPMCAPSTDCVGLHHTAVRVVDIERSLAFYGILGFVVSEKFLTPAGERACFVEGLGVRLELVESTTGAGVAGVQYWPGFLTFDVTKIAVSLDTWLDHLQRRNGGLLTISAEPANQVIGSNVISVATIEDPDGLPIDFIRREGQIPAALTARVNW